MLDDDHSFEGTRVTMGYSRLNNVMWINLITWTSGGSWSMTEVLIWYDWCK